MLDLHPRSVLPLVVTAEWGHGGEPDRGGVETFVAAAPDQPVVMLNLLRFADGGAQRYEEYLRHLGRHLTRVGGRVVCYGRGADPVVAENGQAWDAVLLVSYPSPTLPTRSPRAGRPASRLAVVVSLRADLLGGGVDEGPHGC